MFLHSALSMASVKIKYENKTAIFFKGHVSHTGNLLQLVFVRRRPLKIVHFYFLKTTRIIFTFLFKASLEYEESIRDIYDLSNLRPHRQGQNMQNKVKF